MEKSNKKKIVIVVVVLLALFLLSFFVAKTITDNNKNNKDSIVNNVTEKDTDKTSDDNSSTKSQEKNDEQEETFLIKFAYDNGIILQSTFVKKGEMPVYAGPTPYIKGYKFIGWNRKIRVASEDTTYYAVFRKIETEEKEEKYPYIPPVYYTITVEIAEGQEGRYTDFGGSGTYARGANVEIYANPDDTYATEWDDGNTSNPRNVTVTCDKTYIASFVEGKKLTYLDSSSGLNKIVSIKKDEIIKVIFEHGTVCNEELKMNDDKDANALYNSKGVDSDWTFKGYVYNNQVSPKTLTAAFVKKVEITTTVNNVSWGIAYSSTTDPLQPSSSLNASVDTKKYDKGSDVYIYAKPLDDEHDFVKWSDNSTENPRKVTADSNTTYTAIFADDYNYMYIKNIGATAGKVSMSAEDGDETIYKKNLGEYVLYVSEGHPDGYYECPVPEFYLEYRVDTYNNGSYDCGFWKPFNSVDNFKIFEKVSIDDDQRICFRAGKNKNGKNINTHFSYMYDLPSDGETSEFYRKSGTDYLGVNQLVSAGIFSLEDSTFELCGSIMSLLDGRGSKDSNTVFINSSAKQDNYFTFGCMFYGEPELTKIADNFVTPKTISIACYYSTFRRTGLTEIPSNLLPATQLENSCYAYMFEDCNSLTTIPAGLLPATYDENTGKVGLTGRCYWYMFSDCDELVNVPSELLPAKKLIEYSEKPHDMSDADWEKYLLKNSNCYRGMFAKCTKLKQAPNLPATVLQPSCYEDMFNRCSSLETAPYLPAENLVKLCYSKMFYGCSKLNKVEVGFSSFDGFNDATALWLGSYEVNEGTPEVPDMKKYGPSQNSGTFIWNGDTGQVASGSESTIPTGWTKQKPIPPLFLENSILHVDNEIVPDIINDETENCEYILKVDIIDDQVWYSVYKYNEDSKLYDFISSDMKIDIDKDYDYGLNYFYSNDDILDVDDIACVDGSSLINTQEA